MQMIVSALGVASIVLFVLGPALAYSRMVPPLAGFGLFALAALLGLAAVGLAVAVALTGYGVPWLGVLGMPAATVAVVGVLAGLSVPRINDISTDLEDPPAFRAAQSFPGNGGRDFAFPAQNAPLIEAHYPTLSPLAVNAPADAVFETVQRLAQDWPGWQQVQADGDTRTVEAYATTGVFRFHDDVVIRVRPLERGSRVDMRSKSRDGESDFGVNAKRIEAFLDALRAELKEVSV